MTSAQVHFGTCGGCSTHAKCPAPSLACKPSDEILHSPPQAGLMRASRPAAGSTPLGFALQSSGCSTTARPSRVSRLTPPPMPSHALNTRTSGPQAHPLVGCLSVAAHRCFMQMCQSSHICADHAPHAAKGLSSISKPLGSSRTRAPQPTACQGG